MDLSRDDLKQAMIDAMKESGRDINLSTDDLEKSLKALTKQTKDNKSTMGGLLKDMITGQKSYKDLSYTIRDLDKKIEELGENTDTASKKQRESLQVQRENMQLVQQQNAAQRAAVEGLTTFTKSVGATAGRTVGNFARNLQDGAGAFTLAGGLMEGALDGINAGAQALGGGLTTIGSTMAVSTIPQVRALGIVSAGAGIAISALGSAAALGKSVVSFLVKEMEKTISNYQKISAAGALFADGMTGMRTAASQSFLTINQFGEVLSKMSGTFAESGLSVGGAVKMIGQVGKVMGDANNPNSIRGRLLALGYSFQEQVELQAEVMSDMRKANSVYLNDPQKIAQTTEEYAKNLRIISAVTGEDARKKMEEARKGSAQTAFRARLMELEAKFPGTMQATLTAMATMTPEAQQALREQIVYNGIRSKDLAVTAQLSQGFNQEVTGMANMIKSGNLRNQEGIDQSLKIQAEGRAQHRKDLESQELISFGMASMAGKFPGVETALQNYTLSSDKITKDGIEAAKKAAEAQARANDELTNKYVIAAIAAQNLAIVLQEEVLGVLQDFAKVSANILEFLSDGLKELGLGKKAKKFSFGDVGKEAMTYGSIGAGTGAVIGSAAGGVGAGPGALIGGATGALVGAGTSVVRQLFGSGSGPNGELPNAGASDKGKKPDLSTISSKTGASTQVGAQYAGAFQSLINQLDAAGYEIRSLGGYNDRDVRGKPGVKSIHAHGAAIDINPGTNPMGPGLITDMPPGIGKLANSLGLGWGGDWKSVKDAMHFSAARSEGGSMLQARDGNVFSGPDSGYPATLHGTEAVVPLPDGRNIPVKMDTSELVSKLEELIGVMKDQGTISKRMLHAVQ
jgi:hypothetical protein